MSIFYFLPEEAPTPPTRRERTLHGQKPPLKPREVWAIRTRLQIQGKQRDLALFNLAIDSKCAAVTWWLCETAISSRVTVSQTEPSPFSKRPVVPSSLS